MFEKKEGICIINPKITSPTFPINPQIISTIMSPK